MIRYGKCDCGGEIMLNLKTGVCMCQSCKDNWAVGRVTMKKFVTDALALHETKADGVTRFELTREEYEECVEFMKDLEEYSRRVEERRQAYKEAVKSDSICLKSPVEALNLEPLNVQRHRTICAYLTDLYARKNKDYGDSFHLTFVEEGMAMARIRLGDKFNRFKTLSRMGGQQVMDESLRDTLLDMANYCIMTAMEMDREAEGR